MINKSHCSNANDSSDPSLYAVYNYHPTLSIFLYYQMRVYPAQYAVRSGIAPTSALYYDTSRCYLLSIDSDVNSAFKYFALTEEPTTLHECNSS